ncbi:MAG: hypothetical protein JRI25_28020 [Deltaproteobacteria bacterium]|nr:hypothetical protein [Deltaproteobacteria bacterium]
MAPPTPGTGGSPWTRPGTQGGTQHPYYDFKMQGNGQLKLTEVRLATATISFPADMAGEVAVLRLPERTPIAEVAKPEGRVVTLALEPGAYLLRRRVEGGVQEVTISLSEGSELVVDRWGDTEVEMASRKGGTADENEYVYISSPIKWDPDLQKLKLDLTRIGEGLKESPGVAGGLSVIPGLGQAYNGRWARAAGFLSATIALHSIGWTATTGPAGSLTGPNVLTFLAFATHGWAVSDAIWNVHRQEDFRPMAGVTISAETSWVGAHRPRPRRLGAVSERKPLHRRDAGHPRAEHAPHAPGRAVWPRHRGDQQQGQRGRQLGMDGGAGDSGPALHQRGRPRALLPHPPVFRAGRGPFRVAGWRIARGVGPRDGFSHRAVALRCGRGVPTDGPTVTNPGEEERPP